MREGVSLAQKASDAPALREALAFFGARGGAQREQHARDYAFYGDDFTVSAEVSSTTWEGMYKEGLQYAAWDKHIIVKVPMTQDGIIAVQKFKAKRIRTNVTLCFSPNQALLAAKAGAFVVSPFVGRVDDHGGDGMASVKEMRKIFDNYQFETKILVASVRHPKHVLDAALAGGDIATIPFKVFEQLFQHPLTDKGLAQFQKDEAAYKAQLALKAQGAMK